MDDTWPTSVDRALCELGNKAVVELALKGAAREISFLRKQIRALERGTPVQRSDGPAMPPPRHHDPVAGATVRKTYRDRTFWSGLSAQQSFRVEVACLTRLERGPHADRFPALTMIDARSPAIRVTAVGTDLAQLRKGGLPVAVPDARGQVAEIVAGLAAAGVVHLDLHRSGKNLCVDARGRLALIDFDQAALDGRVWSGAAEERLAQLGPDPVQGQHRRLIEILNLCNVLRDM
jgi:hypothetical protein